MINHGMPVELIGQPGALAGVATVLAALGVDVAADCPGHVYGSRDRV
ncbi:MAG: hypothetical protein NVS3B26_24370 [Mycobacteriales bacterium]